MDLVVSTSCVSHGNTIIQNDDEDGGITITSKGYLNLVVGKERVDLVGDWSKRPSEESCLYLHH